MAADDEDSPTRGQLERIAFARADTPAGIAAAEAALEKLVALDARLAAARLAAVSPESQTVAAGAGDPPIDDGPAASAVEDAPRRARSRVALLVLVGLFVGAVGGVFLAHSQGASIDPTTADQAASTPSAGPTADAGAALKSLLVPQTKADKAFPLQSASTTLDFQPASIHRILTAADGATLWAGRTDTDICLMWTEPSTADGSAGGIGCATPTAFADGGIKLSEGLVTWTWNGTAFTTTVAN